MAASASSNAARLPRKRQIQGSSVAASTSASALIDLSPLQRSSLASHEYQEQDRRRASRQTNRIREEEEEAAISSSMSDLSSSDDEDDDEHEEEEDSASHARQAKSRKSTKKSTATWRPDRRYTGRKQRWSQDEDRCLITAVDRHGKQWDKIYAILKQSAAPGGPHRSQATLNNRYSLLLAQAVRQRDLAASSRPQQQQQQSAESVASLLSASKALHVMAAQLPTPWTRKELDKLAALGPLADSRPAVYEAFCLAFPRTARTQRSVINKWQRIRAAGGKGRRRRYCKEDKEDGDEDDAEDSEGESEDVELAMGVNGGMARSKRSLQRSVAAGRGAKTSITFHTAHSTTTTTRGQASPQGSTRRPLQSGFAPQPFIPSHQALNLRTLDVTIKLEHDGFHISSLPPGYGLLIHSPTQCQVMSPDELLLLVSKDLEQGQEEDLKPMLAPFAFKAANDGSIQALALPLGSTMSVSLVPAFEAGQRVGRHARERKRARASTMVESRFQGPDGYLVVFTSCLE